MALTKSSTPIGGKSNESRFKALEHAVKGIGDKVDLIYSTLVGNESLDQTGLIQRLKKAEAKALIIPELQGDIKKLQSVVDALSHESNKQKTFRHKLIGAFIASAGLWTVLWELIKKFIIK